MPNSYDVDDILEEIKAVPGVINLTFVNRL